MRCHAYIFASRTLRAGITIAAVAAVGAPKQGLAADQTAPADPGASLPAVSARNYSLGGYGAYGNGGSSGAGLGSVTVPLGHAAGAQLDSTLGVDDGRVVGQAEGHLFLRDPALGMLGFYGGYARTANGFDRDGDGWRLGTEGELYRGPYTLSGLAGWDIQKQRMFGEAKVSAYVTDNTKIYGAYLYEGRNVGALGTEHLFAGYNTSIFAEARMGSGDYRGGLIGVRFYLGTGSIQTGDRSALLPGADSALQVPRSLLQRDREDVVPLWMQVSIDGARKHGKNDAAPTARPTSASGASSTSASGATPTVQPTSAPTVQPTSAPTVQPTSAPTVQPTSAPTVQPTSAPTVQPTSAPTVQPTSAPTVQPTSAPTVQPTSAPTVQPTSAPTVQPTSAPTVQPTSAPTVQPTSAPTVQPTSVPTVQPTTAPTVQPTSAPTVGPTVPPAVGPTVPPI